LGRAESEERNVLEEQRRRHKSQAIEASRNHAYKRESIRVIEKTSDIEKC
jgi:hypothetical protein